MLTYDSLNTVREGNNLGKRTGARTSVAGSVVGGIIGPPRPREDEGSWLP